MCSLVCGNQRMWVPFVLGNSATARRLLGKKFRFAKTAIQVFDKFPYFNAVLDVPFSPTLKKFGRYSLVLAFSRLTKPNNFSVFEMDGENKGVYGLLLLLFKDSKSLA